jgi:hypothetical protein
MTTNALVEPTLVSDYANKISKRFLQSILHVLPQGNLTIEGMMIKGDRVEVKYKLQDSPTEKATEILPDDRSVAVNSMYIFKLGDTRIMEHRDNVYQVKTL